MKTIEIKTGTKIPKDYWGDLGLGYIVQKDSLYYGIYISCKCIPNTERILFVTTFGDKLRISYPNTSIRKFEDNRNPKKVRQLIENYHL